MRISRDTYFMSIAKVVSMRGECIRRQVGAVIVDKRGRILSTGMNGVAPGQTPCIDKPCAGAKCPSGEGLDLCEASHAEISALVALEKPFEAHTLYCTTAPCVSCTKALLLTTIERVVYLEAYPTSGMSLWLTANRRWDMYHEPPPTEGRSVLV
jgi:dCMP deaminase